MNKTQWLNGVRNDWDALCSITLSYHPANGPNKDMMNITAQLAEAACEVVRDSYREDKPVTQQLLDEWLEDGDYSSLSQAFSAAWFGVPESTDCWGVEGFSALVDVLDNPVDEDEDETTSIN